MKTVVPSIFCLLFGSLAVSGNDARGSGSNGSERDEVSFAEREVLASVERIPSADALGTARFSALRDAPVVDREGRELGQVADLALDGDRVIGVYLRIAPLRGFGGDLLRVPVDALERVGSAERRESPDGQPLFRLSVEAVPFEAAVGEAADGLVLPDGSPAEIISADRFIDAERAGNVIGARVAVVGGESIGVIRDLEVSSANLSVVVEAEAGESAVPRAPRWPPTTEPGLPVPVRPAVEATTFGEPGGTVGETSTAGSGTAITRDLATTGTAIIGGRERSPGEGAITEATGPATQPGALARDITDDPRNMPPEARRLASPTDVPPEPVVLYRIPLSALDRERAAGSVFYRLRVTMAAFERAFGPESHPGE